ncbi:MAG: chromate transporter [Epulopiscium sp.]|jgi:chromate transporter|nr:chromate transporter [Candidatus Epulonipiscium sp.]
MKELWDLFFTFGRIGGFTFGGGYAMLPMLQKEVVEKKHWATEDELLDYFAIGQCTPGVIAVNTATFIGYKNRGVLGAIFATTGLVCPSFFIILLIASFLKNLSHMAMVQHALGGIRVVVCALLILAIFRVGKKTAVDKLCVFLMILTFCLSVILKASPVIIVFGSAILGLLLPVIRRKAQ